MRLELKEKDLKALRGSVARFAEPGASVRAFPIVAVDPGKRSMGWAVIDGTGALHSGQGTPREIVPRIIDVLDVAGLPMCFAAEAPYSMSTEVMTQQKKSGPAGGRGSNVVAVYAMARATGYVEGALRRHLERAAPWEPKPMTWRSVLGLNRRGTDDLTARDATAEAVLLWVRATTRLTLRAGVGEQAYDEIDRAMALALAHAAHAVVRSIHAQRTPPPVPKVPRTRGST